MNHITRLAEAFQAYGKELYLVGGTVRDKILGRLSNDIDCATNALPDEIKQIAATTNPLYIVPIGEKFGTIQLYYTQLLPLGETYGEVAPLIIEVTTYRGERYTTGSRHPEVQFGTSLIEDLRRRDFTMNAIAKDALTGEIVDPFNGLLDIYNCIIRAVENPTQRFTDDPLRMLRGVRFARQLGFYFEAETVNCIKNQAAHILDISQERIRDEISKMLVVDNPDVTLRLLYHLRLMFHILPEVEALQGVDQSPHHRLDVFDHTMRVVRGVPPRFIVRLAALLHDIAKPQTRTVDEQGITHFYEHEDRGAEMARTILRRLRFGNDVIEPVVKIVALHMRVNAYTPKWSNGAVRRLYIDAGDVLEDLLDLAIADGTSDRDEPTALVQSRIEHLRERLLQVQVQAEVQPLACPLNGDELMRLFDRKPGTWIKPIKQYLHDLVIDGVLNVEDKDKAITYAREYAERQDK